MNNDDPWPPLDILPSPIPPKEPDGPSKIQQVVREGLQVAALGVLSGLHPVMDLTREWKTVEAEFVAGLLTGIRPRVGPLGVVKRCGKNALFLTTLFAIPTAIDEAGSRFFQEDYSRPLSGFDVLCPQILVGGFGISAGLGTVLSATRQRNALKYALIAGAGMSAVLYLQGCLKAFVEKHEATAGKRLDANRNDKPKWG